MPMPPFPDVSKAKVFPEAESNWLEFKQAVCVNFPKILTTMCALLNSGGGYIVCGVMDKSNQICGIRRADHDRFALKVDEAYKNSEIFFDTGETMPLETIRVSMILADEGKKCLTVVTCTPEEGRVYRMKNGDIWHRLSASNFRQIVPLKIYSEENVKEMKKKYKTILKLQSTEYDILLERAREMEKKVAQLQEELEATEANLGLAKEQLADVDITLKAVAASHEKAVKKFSETFSETFSTETLCSKSLWTRIFSCLAL